MKKIIFCLLLLTFNCDNGRASLGKYRGVPFPVISSLFNQRMLLLLKLTYATDSPLEFSDYSNGTGQLYQDSNGNGTAGADPTFDLNGLPLAQNLNFFIDIGEIRISSKFDLSVQSFGVLALNDINKTRRFWDRIAVRRQVYCSQVYSLGDNSCFQTGKIYWEVIKQLFNGEGVQYPSVDPTAEDFGRTYNTGTLYPATGLFVRNFITGWARENNTLITNTLFDNNRILTGGANIIPRNNFNPGTPDVDKNTTRAPQMFPVFTYLYDKQLDDMRIRPGIDPYILEVRANVKENLMVHSYTTLNNTTQTVISFSDWRLPHSGESDMGGNLLLRSRVIYPETAASLNITGGTRSRIHYYAIYREDENNFKDFLPLIATPVKEGTSKIKYISPGRYRLRCLADTTPQDGFPETLVRETTFGVSLEIRQQLTVSLTCP
jgi:hypothetical protein